MNRDIRIWVEGSLPERLIQQALDRGAVFARIRRTGPRSMILSADPRSAEILTNLCRRYGLNHRELNRGGWTSIAQCLRRRWTLLPGLLLCICLCIAFLSRIWIIDIRFTGGAGGNNSQIIACLDEGGIRPGMYAGSIDADLLQKQLLARTGNTSFTGVRVQGIRLLIEVSPETAAPPLYAIEQPRDLVAARSGVVDEINVYSGTACVKPGDTVLAGEMLIRGEETIGKDTETGEAITTAVGALGRVTARCWFEGSAEGDIENIIWERTGETRIECRLRLRNFSLPVLDCEGFASEETDVQVLPVVGLFLPLEIERTVHHETAPKTVEPNPEALAGSLYTIARADAMKQIADAGIEYEIAAQWADQTINGNTLQIRAVYEIYTDIAAERDALIEEVY